MSTNDTSASGYVSRAYRDEADYGAMRAFLVRNFAAAGHPVFCTIGDLDWWRFQTDDPDAEIAAARLWFAPSGEIAGFAWPDKNDVDVIVHPDHKSLEDQIYAWAENRWFALPADENVEDFGANVFERDTARAALLTRRGYRRGEPHYVYRIRPLSLPIPDTPLPDGYAIRHVRDSSEAAKRVAVHHSAFVGSTMNETKYRQVMTAPTYRPELDLVAVDPHGTFAAFTIVWHDTDNHLGVFEPVGCHADHRRQGLARAVMCEGLRRLVSQGAKQALVASQPGNDAANPLYESLGFADAQQSRPWFKPRPDP